VIAIRVIFPVGMLGAGFPAATIERGLAMGAHAIAVDGGSTDSGPYYLGTATAKTTAEAVRRDLHVLLVGARVAGVPLIVTSCGTSGTDAGVDWVATMVRDIAAQERLSLRLARIYSEQDHGTVLDALSRQTARPLPPAGPLRPETVRSCSHIVAVMGHEPIAAALDSGADVVLAGRATDTASVAAVALRQGLPLGPSWHAAKTVECGGFCTTDPQSGGVLVTIDPAGFTVEPLAESAACTPTSVAAHMIYENVDPFRMREPAGTLDTSYATYAALDARRVRVEGSRFELADQYTIKLEGSARVGYETMTLVGIRDRHILTDLDAWITRLKAVLPERVHSVLNVCPGEYEWSVRCYGANAVLGALEPETASPREVGVLFLVRAASQELATAVAKVANPLLLHMPLAGMTQLPSFAFAMSPAEVPRGAVYEFALNHAVDVDDPQAMFRTEFTDVDHG
jgi:hypothetical protein